MPRMKIYSNRFRVFSFLSKNLSLIEHVFTGVAVFTTLSQLPVGEAILFKAEGFEFRVVLEFAKSLSLPIFC